MDGINALWLDTLTPIARMHDDVLATYDQLATTTATIAQRLGAEVQPGLDDLNGLHESIANNVTAYEQARHQSLYEPIKAAAERLGGSILAATRNLGAASGD